MTDNVLQSFCERCGKRYTFTEPTPEPVEPSRPKRGLFGRRSSDEPPETPKREVATTPPSSERFAGTFHFCLDCRQYTCTSCWNPEAGGCLSCRPPKRAGEAAAPDAAQVSPFAAQHEPTSWPSDDVAKTAAADTSATSVPTDTRPPWRAGAEPDDDTTQRQDLDEWGRPRVEHDHDVATSDDEDLRPSESEPEPDPWRGVVFSEDEAGQEDSTASSAAEPSLDLSSRLARQETSKVWPEVERQVEQPAVADDEPKSWPDTDRPSEVAPEASPAPEPLHEEEPLREEEPLQAEEAPAVTAVPEPTPPRTAWVRSSATVYDAVAAGEFHEQPDATPEPSVPDEFVEAEQPEPPLASVDATEAEPPVEAPLQQSTPTAAKVRPTEAEAETPEVPTVTTPDVQEIDASLAELDTEPLAEAEPEPAVVEAEPEPAVAEVEPEPAVVEAEPEPPVVEAAPPVPALAPIEPPPSIETWSTTGEPGPFQQPYEAPVTASPPVASAPEPSAPPLPPVASAPEPSAPPPLVVPPPGQTPAVPATAIQPPTPAAPAPFVPPSAQPGATASGRPQARVPAGGKTHACASCGLPLSAKARFCRRCGAPQA